MLAPSCGEALVPPGLVACG